MTQWENRDGADDERRGDGNDDGRERGKEGGEGCRGMRDGGARNVSDEAGGDGTAARGGECEAESGGGGRDAAADEESAEFFEGPIDALPCSFLGEAQGGADFGVCALLKKTLHDGFTIVVA